MNIFWTQDAAMEVCEVDKQLCQKMGAAAHGMVPCSCSATMVHVYWMHCAKKR